jgi:uncharacterized repeat protein (TIGR01451 family)
MKKIQNNSIAAVLAFSFILAAFIFAGPIAARAATSPSLGAAASYSVLAGAGITNGGSGVTTISGDLGIYPINTFTDNAGIHAVFQTAGNPHLGDTSAQNAQAAQLAIFNGPTGIEAGSQPCTQTYHSTQNDLSGLVLDPGVYCTDAASDFILSGTLTLRGTSNPASDVWIFRSERDFITSGSVAKVVFSGTGGYPCNVWWRVANNATFTGGTTMVGNILAHNAITFGQSATLDGRALAYVAAVTLLGNTITGPTCSAAGVGINRRGTINVVKTVVNDNGGTKVVSDFPLFVNGTPVISGQTNFFPALVRYTVTETSNSQYARTFSGDCDSNGQLLVNPNNNYFCVITNNDIGAPVVVPPVPPLIDVVKVPTPLALPAGPGAVTYNYTLHNIGTVPVTNVTMIDNACSPVTLVSGDANSDGKLDLTETWKYVCSTNISTTTTNIVVATGWANGISATSVANATVAVGTPVEPPLIHVTKIPNPLTLLVGGGMVTYTEKITNPGTVALNNVTLVDNKCSPMKYISGDTNSDSKLDPSETWTYTCRTNLTKTTTNTAIAAGEANGFTVRDLAVATVVVAGAAPKLPNTGSDSGKNIPWNIAMLAGIVTLVSVSLVIALKKLKI